MKGETFSTAGVIIFTFFREAFETLAVPSLSSTVPTLLHSDLLNMSVKALGAKKKKNWGEKRNWGGDVQGSQGVGGKGKGADYPNTVIKGEMCFSGCQDD